MTLDVEQIQVRPATLGDLHDVLAILSEAAGWLQSRGIDQWPDPFPKKIALPSLNRGETFLAHCDDRPAGTITLLHSYSYWPGSPPDALYVRRIAIGRGFVGLGRFLMGWAEHQALSQGKEFLRLDCYSGNAGLRSYYEDLGFEHQGDIEVTADRGTYNCSLYGKRIAPIPDN